MSVATQPKTDILVDTVTKTRPFVPRLWLLTNAPSPYQVELFTEVAKRDDVELVVRFMRGASRSGQAAEAATDFDARVLWGVFPESVRDEFRLHPKAVWEVIRGRHDVHVLSGLITSPTFLMCALASIILNRKYVLWLERPRASSIVKSRQWHRRILQSIKQNYLRWLLRHAAQVWCIGSRAETEYQAYADLDGTTRVLPYCCRVDRFVSQAAFSRELRSRHDLDGRFVFLFSGQLIHRKGVDTLLSAFAPVARQRADALLLLLGDGPSKDEYVALARKLGVESQVRFLGHRPQTELPDWYALSDVFVFPSRHDGWAVVVNEACAAGLPVIASAQTGAAGDLVEDGVNGYIVDCEDINDWTRRMLWCIDHRQDLSSLGAASRRMIEPFSSTAGAAKMAGFTHDLLQRDSKSQCTTAAS